MDQSDSRSGEKRPTRVSFRCAAPISRPMRALRWQRHIMSLQASPNQNQRDNLWRQFLQIEGQPLNWPPTLILVRFVSFNSFPKARPNPFKSARILFWKALLNFLSVLQSKMGWKATHSNRWGKCIKLTCHVVDSKDQYDWLCQTSSSWRQRLICCRIKNIFVTLINQVFSHSLSIMNLDKQPLTQSSHVNVNQLMYFRAIYIEYHCHSICIDIPGYVILWKYV